MNRFQLVFASALVAAMPFVGGASEAAAAAPAKPAAAPTTTNIIITPTTPVYDSVNVSGVAGESAPGFSSGSIASGGVSKTDLYLRPAVLFGRPVTLAEIARISYWTKKSTTHVANAADWFLAIYTNPYAGDVSTATWYGDRIGSEPYFSNGLSETAGDWNLWSTDGPTNKLRWFESTQGAPGATFGSYTDPDWSAFLAANALSGQPRGTQQVLFVSIQTGSAWASGFTGQVDGLKIELADGSVANVNFEASLTACTTICYVSTTGSDLNGGGLGDPKRTIQAAINQVSAVGTVNVAAGIYNEAVTVNKSIALLGAQAGVDARARVASESIVQGPGGSTAFSLLADSIGLDGFTVQNATNGNSVGAAIYMGPGKSGGRILNNIVQDSIIGMYLANTSAGLPALVQHNVFRNNNAPGPASGTGIYADQYSAGGKIDSVLIDGNLFSGNADAGIDFSSTDAALPATNIVISNNMFDTNGRGMVAFNLTNSQIRGNTFQNSIAAATADLRLFEGSANLTIDHNVFKNGAGRAYRANNIGTGSPDPTGILLNRNAITGYAGPAFTVQNDAGPTLDATCNWFGAANGPSGAGPGSGSAVGPNIAFNPWLTATNLNGPCVGGTAMFNKQQIRAMLAGMLPTDDKKTDEQINKAIDSIDKSLAPNLWADASHLTEKGQKVFEEEKKAVEELMKVKGPLAASLMPAIMGLAHVDGQLAQTAIDEAPSGKDKDKAINEMTLAAADMTNHDCDKAIEDYKKAWQFATKN